MSLFSSLQLQKPQNTATNKLLGALRLFAPALSTMATRWSAAAAVAEVGLLYLARRWWLSYSAVSPWESGGRATPLGTKYLN